MEERTCVPPTFPLNCMHTIVLLILLALVISSCEDMGQPLDYVTGTYEYTGYDLDGNAVVSGTLILLREDGEVRGQKLLSGASPDSGIGNVSGELIQPTVLLLWLYSGPELFRIYIQGSITNGVILGDRFIILDRQPGPPEKIGTFRAVRRTYNR